MIVHGYFRSSAAYRLRIALNLKRLGYGFRSVHLRKGEQRSDAYRALNPQGLVPALETDDGAVLTQSLAIVEWLDETHPEPPLLPGEPAARARARAFAQVIACDVHPVQNLKVLNRLRALGHDEEQVNGWAREVIAEGLAACESLIRGEGPGPFCFGDQPTLADICIVPQLFNARRFDVVASALYVTPERARQVDFLPYLKSGASLLVRSDDGFRPQRAEDLCGKRVASIKGGSWIPRLLEVSRDYCEAQGKPAIQSREFPTSPEAAQALLAKAVDVQFENAAVAKITAEKLQGRLQIASRELIYPVVIGLAVRKGNGELLDGLRQGFEAMKQDGEYQALLARYNLAEPSAADVAQALGN